MDALPIEETTVGLEYKSKNKNTHACGHDAHMATIVGVGYLLYAKIEKIPSNKTVRLIFQPAEEGNCGAKNMIEANVLEGLDEIYGYHVWNLFPLGRVKVKSGPLMAHSAHFIIEIRGSGGHASTPENTTVNIKQRHSRFLFFNAQHSPFKTKGPSRLCNYSRQQSPNSCIKKCPFRRESSCFRLQNEWRVKNRTIFENFILPNCFSLDFYSI